MLLLPLPLPPSTLYALHCRPPLCFLSLWFPISLSWFHNSIDSAGKWRVQKVWLHHNDLNWHPQLWQRHRSCSSPTSLSLSLSSISFISSSCCCCCFKSNATAFHTWRWRFTVSPRVASPVSLSPATALPRPLLPSALCCLLSGIATIWLPTGKCRGKLHFQEGAGRWRCKQSFAREWEDGGCRGRGNFKNYLLPETLTSFCSLLVISWGSCYL